MNILPKQWEIFWEIPGCPPFLTSEPARLFTNGMRDFCGVDFPDCILEYRHNTNIWYLDANEWSKLDKVLFERIIEDMEWGKKINLITEQHCYPCLEYVGTLKNRDFSLLSNEELFNEYDKFMGIYIPAHASGHPANVLEMKNQRLSGYLKEYTQRRIWTIDYEGNANDIFSKLVAPTKDMSPQLEAKSLYTFGLVVAKEKDLTPIFKEKTPEEIRKIIENNFPGLWQKLTEHYSNFCWTIYNWEGPANTVETYIDSVSSLFRQGKNFADLLKKISDEQDVLISEQKSIKERLGVDKKHETLLQIASDIMFLKALRKDCMYKSAWLTEGLFKEIGSRLGLTVHEARYIFYFEMQHALLKGRIEKNIIQDRTKEVVLHQRAGHLDSILQGREATKFINSLNVKTPDYSITQISGQVAFAGKAKGRVKYVNTPDVMDKMEEGDILMAYATQPNLLPAMRKASAFITEFGGITCHAAIVSREWKVPCVVGLKDVTKILKDGDLIEVDADNGVVRKIL